MWFLIISTVFAQEAAIEAPAPTNWPTSTAAPGSLWSDSQMRMLVGLDGNARAIGDLVTVHIEEQTRTELSADTSTGRSSTTSASVDSLFGIRNALVNRHGNLEGSLGMGVTSGSEFNGDGDTSREGSLEGVLTCQVVEVLPNGHLHIFGRKEVRSNRETQYLVLEGVVRPQDIQADNTINSRLIAESRIEFTGRGVIDDKQGPGIGQRVVDRVWPF